MKIAIVGSGLAALATAKSLIKRGVKPHIIDAGLELDEERLTLVERLSKLPPQEWSENDINAITANPTVHAHSLPKKLVFGSDYFYAGNDVRAAISGRGETPPFSYAKGGFSVGWGAAVLPADDCDLDDWPIRSKELSKYYEENLRYIPYSSCEDELSLNFPLYKSNPSALRLSKGNASILSDLKKSGLCQKNHLVFGQARLLVSANDTKELNGCQYCGYCMSGCVYGCIFKANNEFERLAQQGQLIYQKNLLVTSLKEENNKVELCFYNAKGNANRASFDRIFLAAGAVNSTRIILQSKKLYGQPVLLKSRAGFVAPLLRWKKTPIEWPNINTQPGIFLEFKVPNLDNHWVHTQLSTPNELVFEKLKYDNNKKNIIQNVKKYAMEHLLIAFCNMHSTHSNGYVLRLEEVSGKPVLRYQREEKDNSLSFSKTIRHLRQICRQINCYPIIPLIKNNSGSYHVGGSLPMRVEPKKATETDIWGKPLGFKRIHVVDSSVFPSLPGTTIGLLAMANASRIASEIELV